MGFLDWLFGKKSSESDPSFKTDPSKTMEFVKGPSPEQENARRAANKWKFTEIGNTEPLCPYCKFKFEKMPQRKKECPNCKKTFYSRTRPIDHKKVLVTTDQLTEVERQNAIDNGSFDERQQTAYNASLKELREKFGREPSHGDTMWHFLNGEARYYASSSYWGLYRNVIFMQAQLLEREGNLKQSLEFYLWVCYLDINGANNGPPRFNPEMGFLAPGIIEQCIKIGKELKLSREEIKTIFLEYNKRISGAMRPPISPNMAWEKIEKEALNILD
jgi:hypothetical protein